MQEKLEERLSDLVSYRTETEDVATCTIALTKIANELKNLGLHVHLSGKHHPWLIATTKKTKHPRLLLASHLDVVQASKEKQYTMKVDDDILVGRGVFDMKSGLACFLELLQDLKHNLKKLDVGLLIVTDEEIGGLHGASEFVKEGWGADICFLPDGGRGWKVEAKAKGRLSGKLIAQGESSHASRPWEGDNAISKLIKATTEIENHFTNALHDHTTLSFTRMKGGRATNQIPEYAEMDYDVRSFSAHELEKTNEYLDKLAAKHKINNFITTHGNPLQLNTKDPYVQRFFEVYKEVLGKPHKFVDSFGSSDAHYLNSASIPCILIQPGGGGSHGSNEWVYREDLLKFYNLIKAYTLDVASTKEEKPLA